MLEVGCFGMGFPSAVRARRGRLARYAARRLALGFAARAGPIRVFCGFRRARMGALNEFWDVPRCGQSNPIASFGAKAEVPVFAGVVEQVDQQLDVLPAVLLDFVHAAFFPPDQ
jgi:hypothetical protein